MAGTFFNITPRQQRQPMQKITPFLWFNDNAEEAITLYLSLFKDSRILYERRYGAEGPGPKGSLMTAAFVLNGQEFMALNGGPRFRFTEAISMFVKCETQEEIDFLWEKLSAGGEKQMCGWLKDKFGLSWQIIPTILGELLADKDAARAGRVMQAMLQMQKMEIGKLIDAQKG
jgi:predicted 3-demethylubiquinone-9 3-methyltransferase (glyoxalase superfamily)